MSVFTKALARFQGVLDSLPPQHDEGDVARGLRAELEDWSASKTCKFCAHGIERHTFPTDRLDYPPVPVQCRDCDHGWCVVPNRDELKP